MSDAFFRDLQMPEPDIDLGVGSDSHARQTAAIMQAFEPVVLKQNPDWVVVVGDVNSTIACALVATKLDVKVAHVEAGLRSRDRSMPEEINRLLTDQIADLLLTPSQDADANLQAEGIPPARIRFVGNIMIDSLLSNLDRSRSCTVRSLLGLSNIDFAVLRTGWVWAGGVRVKSEPRHGACPIVVHCVDSLPEHQPASRPPVLRTCPLSA